MRKTGHIKETQMYRNLLFEQPVDIQLQAFYQTPLGELYQAIPFDSFAEHIPKPKRAISGKGCKPWFSVKCAARFWKEALVMKRTITR